MNRTFVLDATPAIARKIVRLAEICNVVVDDGIKELAKTGLIPEDHPAIRSFSLIAPELSLVQSLVDCGLRAIVASKRLQSCHQSVLAAICHENAFPVVISTFQPLAWTSKLSKFKHSIDPYDDKADFLIVEPKQTWKNQVLASRRHGTLIVDWTSGVPRIAHLLNIGDIGRGLAQEFPRTIFMVSDTVDSSSFLEDYTHWLYPNASTALIRRDSDSRWYARECGFTTRNPKALSFLFNICSDIP